MSRLLLKKVFIVLSLILLVQPLYADEKPMVFVSIPPQKYFIEQITKDKIDIQVMVPHGKNPYNYQPTDKQMDDLLKAKLYFSIGALFEKKWLETIVNHNPELEIIHTDDTIEKAPETLNFYENGIEQKIAKYQAENGRIDYHTWLSPALIRPQIRFILSALYMIDPKNELTYETNSRQFLVELITLYKEIKQTLSGMEGVKFIGAHPAWGYFAKTFQMEQIPVEIVGNKVPQQLVKYARENNIKLIVQSPFANTTVLEQLSRDIGGVSITADPLSENWADNLLQFSKDIKKQLK